MEAVVSGDAPAGEFALGGGVVSGAVRWNRLGRLAGLLRRPTIEALGRSSRPSRVGRWLARARSSATSTPQVAWRDP